MAHVKTQAAIKAVRWDMHIVETRVCSIRVKYLDRLFWIPKYWLQDYKCRPSFLHRLQAEIDSAKVVVSKNDHKSKEEDDYDWVCCAHKLKFGQRCPSCGDIEFE